MSAVFASSSRLRAMQEIDLPIIIEIEQAAYPFPWTLQIFRDCLRVGYKARVLERDDDIIGYGIMSTGAQEAHILNLCIHPNLQRCGYGQRLLNHLLALARQQNTQTVFLEVRPSNPAAIHLYLKTGFNQIGMRKGYYPNGKQGREDAVIMAKEL